MVDEGQSEARRDASLFQIIYVPDDAIEQTEAMGTKRKFWYEDEDLGLCLFKHSRHDAGEDWAEKMAEQVCDLLGIPHARYELAVWNGQRGVVTPRFTGDEERLIPGNELLMELDPTYPAHASSARLKVPQHTLSAVERVMADPAVGIPSGFAAVPRIGGAWGVFIGYLMLDALIGNSDRHHENWALVESRGAGEISLRRLAPTHDHGSSLGRNEQEARIRQRLATKDTKNTPEAYAARCRSKLYRGTTEATALGTVAAFRAAACTSPDAAEFWLDRLEDVHPRDLEAILDRIPASRISAPAADFALRILLHNRSRLLEVRGSLE
jgi:hypothetical protein